MSATSLVPPLAPVTDPAVQTAKPEHRLHLGSLDAMRGIAIFAVILAHAQGLVVEKDAHVLFIGNPIYGSGGRGVQLFYALSAFTLLLSLTNPRPEASPKRDFFLRRFFRIAPMFYVALILNVIVLQLSGQPALPWYRVLLGVLLLHGLSAHAANTVVVGGWSVGVEVLFYLCLPFVYKYLQTVKATAIAVVVSVFTIGPLCSVWARHATDPEVWGWRCLYGFQAEVPVFLMGFFTFAVYRFILRPYALRTSDRRRKVTSGILLALAPLPLLFAGRLHHLSLYGESTSTVPLILSLMLYPWPPLVNRWSILLGRISYSVYLLHFFILMVLRAAISHAKPSGLDWMHRHPDLAVLSLATIILVVGVPLCMAGLKFVELPGIALGRRLIAHLETVERAKRTPRVA